MRRVLVLCFLALSACDVGQSFSQRESVTVKLPPPKPAQPQPGFSSAVVSSVR